MRSGIINLGIIFMIMSLIIILGGKLLFNSVDQNTFLYGYGIVVTSGILLLFTVRYGFYRDPYHEARALLNENPSTSPEPFASIMVAVHNEEAFIRSCIDSLDRQTYPHREIIVINDASTDNTAAILDQLIYIPTIRIVHLSENIGKKGALAEAMLRARGDVFVFTDSDTILEPTAVEKTVTILNAFPDIGGISGHARAYNARKNILTRIQDSWYEGQFSIRKAYESVFGAVTCVSGPLAVFRRAAVFNLIPAWTNDEFLGNRFRFATDRTKTALVLANPRFTQLVRSQFSDSPFVARERHEPKEWQVVYTKSAQSLTEVPDTWRAFIAQQIRWKKSFLRNIFLTGRFYWRKPLPAALMYYLRALFVVVGPFVVARHMIWLPLNGNYFSGVLYFSGVVFIGLLFAVGHKIERPHEHGWYYRPLMNFLSTFVLSWLVFYSAATIKNMTWSRH